MKPEVDLAIARTYEREEDWTNAVNKLYAWVEANTNHELLPEAEYRLAWAYFKAGKTTRAVPTFTNFAANYPGERAADEAASLDGTSLSERQIMTGGSHFQKDHEPGRRPRSFRKARMRAGQAARIVCGPGELSAGYRYFRGLAKDTNCPPGLQLEAQFAAATRSSFRGANQPGPLPNAVAIFGDIATNHPGDPQAPRAWGRMGDCYQLFGGWGDTNAFLLAINAYGKVLNATNAEIASVRRRNMASAGCWRRWRVDARSGADQLLNRRCRITCGW